MRDKTFKNVKFDFLYMVKLVFEHLVEFGQPCKQNCKQNRKEGIIEQGKEKPRRADGGRKEEIKQIQILD